MIDTNYCYKTLGVSTQILPFFKLNHTQFEYSDYYGFSVYQLPLELILQEPILHDINTKHPFEYIE